MRTKIQRWGNSLGLRIPNAFAKEAGVHAGSDVDLTVEGGRLIVRPVGRPRYQLADLLSGVTSTNVHKEIDSGAPIGREVW